MVTVLIAATLLARQNPVSPCVKLPPDWQIKYFPNNDHRLGLLVGPNGEQILFPAYGGNVFMGSRGAEAPFRYEDTGLYAARLYAQNPKALSVVAWLGGRSVTATLEQDGNLAVSIGKREPTDRKSDFPIDFSTKVQTTRQIVVALNIAFSRLTNTESYAPPKQRTPDAASAIAKVPGDPFPGSVTLPKGYEYRRKSKSVGTFEGVGLPSVEARSLHRVADVPKDAQWTESASLLEGTLRAISDSHRHIAIEFTPAVKAPHFVFVSEDDTPQAALVAFFAALTYRPAAK